MTPPQPQPKKADDAERPTHAGPTPPMLPLMPTRGIMDADAATPMPGVGWV
jgi:hypothetical protein